MPIGFEVLAAGDVNPVVAAVGGFDDGLVEVGVGDEPVGDQRDRYRGPSNTIHK